MAISRGSASEVQSLLYVAADIGYLKDQDAKAMGAMAAACIVVTAGRQRYLKREQ
jgi:hypothetical protein